MSAHVQVLRDELDRTRFINRLRRSPLKDERGLPLLVTARRLRKKRTPKQNRMMHMVWGFFGELAGWAPGEAKEYFKQQHGPVIERAFGGVRRNIPKPSSEYTAQEAQAMIDTVYRIAIENDMVLPEPHDEESWRRYAEQFSE